MFLLEMIIEFAIDFLPRYFVGRIIRGVIDRVVASIKILIKTPATNRMIRRRTKQWEKRIEANTDKVYA